MKQRNLQLGFFTAVAGPTLLLATGFGGIAPESDSSSAPMVPSSRPLVGGGLGVVPFNAAWLLAMSNAPVPGAQPAPPEEEEDELIDPFPDKGEPAITWTVNKPAMPRKVAMLWGIGRSNLFDLNPQLAAKAPVAAGTQLVVDAERTEPGLSVGTPNHGSLRNGVPMPEGSAWRMRPTRFRSYASSLSVGVMASVFSDFGERFPGAPKIFVGELSRRGGGSARPHVSHQSGRDADIGYVLTRHTKGYRFIKATRRNFDAEKNWYLIRALIDSGDVQHVFVGERVRRWLKAEAHRELSSGDALRRYFVRIRVWPGHDDHMHVRFNCASENALCRGEHRGSAGR